MSHKHTRYDVIVVGAGHAGCEAALACARLGKQTALLTFSLENVALMPCNPSIGGSGKAALVREIDALGGEMGKNCDATLMQGRMLNTRKGPAVQSLRVQLDRKFYQRRMKYVLETTPNLFLKEGLVTRLLVENSRAAGVRLRDGTTLYAPVVILATGTYLDSEIHIGDVRYPGAPQGQHPAVELARNLRELLPVVRFKTGTPPRINLRSLDYSKMMKLEGDNPLEGFSFETGSIEIEQVPCWVTYTNEATHAVVQANLHRAALYSGAITGTGPRYCPSIESKVVQFPERTGHQVFVEPEGWQTNEGYLSGLSTSLPADVQIELLQTIPGLENAEIMRWAYAIEYDCLDPFCLESSLMTKEIAGLFCAGQINGTSGYEEAAAQGIVAGINAVRFLNGQEPITISRSQAYIGVLIDDLVTKGTTEPYRMMTSRAEHRLYLRMDNADARLTPLGYEVGLISEERYAAFTAKQEMIKREVERLKTAPVGGDPATNALLREIGTPELRHGVTLAELLRRPEVSYEQLGMLGELPDLPQTVRRAVEVLVKYEGYLRKQQAAIERFERMEERLLPKDIDYIKLRGLSREAAEKLARIRPRSLGQAARISGVSPADVNVLMIYLETQKRSEK